MRKLTSIQDKAEAAMIKAIERVKEEHKKLSLPLAIWEDGKVKYVMVK